MKRYVIVVLLSSLFAPDIAYINSHAISIIHPRQMIFTMFETLDVSIQTCDHHDEIQHWVDHSSVAQNGHCIQRWGW